MDAYDFADKLLECLSEDPITADNLEISGKTFDYVIEKMNEYKIFPKYESLNLFPGLKSDELALNHRLKGNELFKDGKYFGALCSYNKSLCFATPHSEAMGLAFANRSAVYYEIDEFNLCLENIRWAKMSCYPRAISSKLEMREKMSRKQKKMKTKTKKHDTLQLILKRNHKYPSIADCLRLKKSSEFGRHITTSKALKAGDIIAIERPFVAQLQAECVFKRCSTCLGQFNLNLLPCLSCTSAMFCSQKCSQAANDRYHRVECDFSNHGFGEFFTIAAKTALRTFLQSLAMFDWSFENLQEFLEKGLISDCNTVFDIDTKDVNSKQMLLIVIDKLATNEEKRCNIEKFRRATVCVIITDFLEKHTKLCDQLDDMKRKKFLMEFLYKHIQIAESNYHELYALSPEQLMQQNEQFAIGSYPFSSLLNHSCAPNVMRLTFDTCNYIIVSRDIQRGEQVFDNYGFHHVHQKRFERRNKLLERYQFHCSCEACSKNYPLYENLQETDENFDSFIDSDVEKLEMFTVNEARSAIQKYSKYISRNSQNFPCYEISLLQEFILRCFRAFEKASSCSPKLIQC